MKTAEKAESGPLLFFELREFVEGKDLASQLYDLFTYSGDIPLVFVMDKSVYDARLQSGVIMSVSIQLFCQSQDAAAKKVKFLILNDQVDQWSHYGEGSRCYGWLVENKVAFAGDAECTLRDMINDAGATLQTATGPTSNFFAYWNNEFNRAFCT